MLLLLLTLIDAHTLFVLIFYEYLSPIYIFSGTVFAFLKGGIFYLLSRDLFSLLDIIVSILILVLLFGTLWSFLYWIIFVYLAYKIIMGLIFLKI